jgi:predicted nucleotidyltransferase
LREPEYMTRVERYARALDRLVPALRVGYGDRLVAVAVFGSVGRGTPRQGSDIDLLIVARDLPDGRFARLDEFLPLERALEPSLAEIEPGGTPVMVSPVFKSPAEVEHGSPLFFDMVEDARILYDPESFLARYLDRLRARLAELGAQRIWRGEGWYWDLKPDFKPGEIVTLRRRTTWPRATSPRPVPD